MGERGLKIDKVITEGGYLISAAITSLATAVTTRRITVLKVVVIEELKMIGNPKVIASGHIYP